MSQLVSRGRRNAPVKKMRSRWTTIDGHEQQRGPVVQLAHEQAAADVERQPQRRVVGRRHRDAAQRRVGAVVDDLAHRGVEEERQVGARQQQDDERVERDLARAGTTSGRGRPCSASGAASRRRSAGRRARRRPCPSLVVGAPGAVAVRAPSDAPPVPVGGAYGLDVVAARRRSSPSSSTVMGSCGSGRVAGPKTGLAPSVTSELRLVAGAEDPAGLLLVQRDRAAGVRADLGVGDVVAVAEAGLARAGLVSRPPAPGRSRMSMVAASACLLPPGTAGNTVSSEPGSWSPGRIGVPSLRTQPDALGPGGGAERVALVRVLDQAAERHDQHQPEAAAHEAQRAGDQLAAGQAAVVARPPTSVAPAVTRSKCEPSCLSCTAVSCGSSFLVNSTRPMPTQAHRQAHAAGRAAG